MRWSDATPTCVAPRRAAYRPWRVSRPEGLRHIMPIRPDVVVAIPNWNRADRLRECVDSVLACTSYASYRTCVFDQASTDGSLEYLRGVARGVDVIAHPENVGFVSAVNLVAAKYPRSDLAILNNDTRVTPGWLDALVAAGSRSASIGIVGARLVYPDGRLQEAGSQVFADGTAKAFGRSGRADDP